MSILRTLATLAVIAAYDAVGVVPSGRHSYRGRRWTR